MPTLSIDHRRAVELLAKSSEGCTDAIMTAHDFRPQLIAELIDAGLARLEIDRVLASGQLIEIPRLRITEAGRVALATEAR
jgi:hypothetical protein